MRRAIPVLAIALLVVGAVRADVRSMRLGIELSCPFGLGECYPLVYEGLSKLPGAERVAEDADAETGTVVVHPAAGRLLRPDDLERFVVRMRIGTRLRGVEATIDGDLVREGDAFVLRTAPEVSLRLEPLVRTIEWNYRSREFVPPRSSESLASARLAARYPDGVEGLRIIGPVELDAGGSLVIRPREAYAFEATRPRGGRATIGVRVASPYGIVEPWTEVRDAVAAWTEVVAVDSRPDVDSSTFGVEFDADADVRPSDWAHRLPAIGGGVEATGVEVALRGRVIKRQGQLALQVADGRTVALAPVSRNVRWDHRRRREILDGEVERRAYARLLAEWSSLPHDVRVVGPLVERGDRALVEVREFGEPRLGVDVAFDGSAPDAPKAVRAHPIDEEAGVRIRWAPIAAADLAGYRVYGSASATGPFTRLVDAPAAARSVDLEPDALAGAEWIVVTAVDATGNESGFSACASAAPPPAPEGLRARLEGTTALLEWDRSEAPDVETYSLFRASEPDAPLGEIASVLYAPSYVNGGLESGRTYRFAVAAIDTSYHRSALSEIVELTVP